MNNSAICPGQGLLHEFKQKICDDDNTVNQSMYYTPELKQSCTKVPIKSQQQYIVSSIYRTVVESGRRNNQMPTCISGNCAPRNSQTNITNQYNSKNYDSKTDLRISSLQDNEIKRYNNVVDNKRMQQQFQQQKITDQQQNLNGVEQVHQSNDNDSNDLTKRLLTALEFFTQNVKQGKYTAKRLEQVLEIIE